MIHGVALLALADPALDGADLGERNRIGGVAQRQKLSAVTDLPVEMLRTEHEQRRRTSPHQAQLVELAVGDVDQLSTGEDARNLDGRTLDLIIVVDERQHGLALRRQQAVTGPKLDDRTAEWLARRVENQRREQLVPVAATVANLTQVLLALVPRVIDGANVMQHIEPLPRRCLLPQRLPKRLIQPRQRQRVVVEEPVRTQCIRRAGQRRASSDAVAMGRVALQHPSQ